MENIKQFQHTKIFLFFFYSDLDHSFKVTFLSSQYKNGVILSEPTNKSTSGTFSRLLHQHSSTLQLQTQLHFSQICIYSKQSHAVTARLKIQNSKNPLYLFNKENFSVVLSYH